MFYGSNLFFLDLAKEAETEITGGQTVVCILLLILLLIFINLLSFS